MPSSSAASFTRRSISSGENFRAFRPKPMLLRTVMCG